MQIQNLNIYPNTNIYCKKVSQQKSLNRINCNTLSFSGLPRLNLPCNIATKINKQKVEFVEFLNKKGKVTLKEYGKIKEKQPHILAQCYKMCSDEEGIIAQPDTFAKACIALKEYYDTVYENYTILSVGTSPAPFCEIMENIGCKVIYMPISRLNELEENPLHFMRHRYPTIASRHPNIDILMRYCSKKGISKKDKGELIILDFAHTGKTMDTIQKILEERGDISKERLHKHNITDDINMLSVQQNKGKLDWDDASLIENEIRFCCYEKLSNVPHYVYNGNDKYYDKANTVTSSKKRPKQIFKEFDEYSTPLGRAWSLCGLNETRRILKIS